MSKSKNQGIVIDGSMISGETYHVKPSTLTSSENFPSKASEIKKNVQSYSTVIQQAVITQDRPLLKQILIQSEIQAIGMTVSQLNTSKIAGLLSLIEQFVYADCKNIKQFVLWVKEIIIRHLGVLVSNPQNKEVVCRLRKFIGKKLAERNALMNISSRLKVGNEKGDKKEFVARFNYVQTKDQPDLEDNLMMEEIYDDEDEIMAEIDD